MVHPEVVRAQVIGSIVTGIDNALFNNIRIDKGAVANGNFNDNPLPRMTDVPARIEVHLVDSTAKPGGVGEPAVPPLAPALSQAIFALTGQRLRSLPLRPKPQTA
jgi:isoquinoline 1-oxidoreductase beta subunit